MKHTLLQGRQLCKVIIHGGMENVVQEKWNIPRTASR